MRSSAVRTSGAARRDRPEPIRPVLRRPTVAVFRQAAMSGRQAQAKLLVSIAAGFIYSPVGLPGLCLDALRIAARLRGAQKLIGYSQFIHEWARIEIFRNAAQAPVSPPV